MEHISIVSLLGLSTLALRMCSWEPVYLQDTYLDRQDQPGLDFCLNDALNEWAIQNVRITGVRPERTVSFQARSR